jgi:hypothetical protein
MGGWGMVYLWLPAVGGEVGETGGGSRALGASTCEVRKGGSRSVRLKC